jgi:hypothetical protein
MRASIQDIVNDLPTIVSGQAAGVASGNFSVAGEFFPCLKSGQAVEWKFGLLIAGKDAYGPA